ncbi:putative N-acetyltransferase, MSMEG_0567 N-terminal domain family [Hyella patelloides LEGE 07179]|uniref:Putative N-acetyltransferase, MSMEG_0567 N-terminal domain family n=1 Tax=Hyella patelloides LEGE 07179 TaxID=945734 RepID=A0A563W3A5_9CYAN|nr:MSMEG_0567/Sll0786 family nitrogen starvation N-acetyltransferase [Hyella patelloides]VEP18189.1 putative N-acetyltransferase, MSMEG_0567 N-terminal domain family [Hyella patelloides LEGE 07179]
MTKYQFKLALSPTEIAAYYQLRQEIFCQEQGIFQQSDRDEDDTIAYPIIAINNKNQVVGVVRIYETRSRLWYGGRLGVHQDYRRVGRIGKGLIDKAVTTANAWGCDRFLATVQLPNVRFFQRLHWNSLAEMTICDRPHHLMEAQLNFYPPNDEPRPALQFVSTACQKV